MNHKNQNNLHIIHWRTQDNRYNCNQAVKSFDFKMTNEEEKVTCLNCKRYLEKIEDLNTEHGGKK